VIVRIDADDSVCVVAGDLDFPNGMVITPDQRTLIVAESTGRRLSAFTIVHDGTLSSGGCSPTVWRRTARRSRHGRRRRGMGVDDPGS
jgi:sugar lactone lactonase YvrE